MPGLPPNHDTLRYTYCWQAISEVTMPGSLKRMVTTDTLLRPERIRVGTAANPGSVMDDVGGIEFDTGVPYKIHTDWTETRQL